MADALNRGTTEGARCSECPLSDHGMPSKPVASEYPDDPRWLIIGEGPGIFETRRDRPFIGPSGQVVNQILKRIGRPREELYIGNATLCIDGRTAVRLADGSLGRIDQLVKYQFGGLVQSIDDSGSIVARRVIGWHRNDRSNREMFNVSFRWAQRTGGSGRVRSVMTEDHPILTLDGWIPARDVDGGMIATGERSPSKNALQVAWGTLLGDGMISDGHSQLIVRHAVDQQDYLLEKARVLSEFGAKIFTPSRSSLQVQDQIGFVTPGGSWGHAMRDMFYNNKCKRVPRLVLERASMLLFAVWYLDDGSMLHRPPRRPAAEICGTGFLEDDLLAASAALNARGFATVVRRGRIRFDVESTAKFSAAIREFVPPQLDYKLCPNDRGFYKPTTYDASPAVPFFDVASRKSEPIRSHNNKTVYCLDVEGTHNFITTGAVVHNCLPPQGAPVEMREKAAECCKPRLIRELAQFPGKPILTLGAVAARVVIPKATLDAIDPPDVPRSKKRAQKEREREKRKAERKALARKQKSREVIARKRFAMMVKVHRDSIVRELIRRHGRKPDRAYLNNELERVRQPLWDKAWDDSEREYEQIQKERALAKEAKAKKPRKKKPIKITDIVGTLFDVDVGDGVVRAVIPAIHPAALLRGGGATIGGSHTPDMAFVNIVYDAAKVDALARGKDIRLHINVQIEVTSIENAEKLFVAVLQEALDEGACSLDLETYVDDVDRHHALMAYIAKIRVIGIATKKRAVSVAWDLLPASTMSYFQLVLGTCAVHYHHGLYDKTVLRNQHYGFIIPIVGVDEGAPGGHDSLYAHHAAFPGNSHKLQNVTAQFYAVAPWKSEFHNADETPEKLATYNALDAGSTHADVTALTVWVKRTDTEKVYERDRRMCDIASRMHLRGMPVSREVNTQLVSIFTRLAREAKRAVEERARDPKMKELIQHHLAILLAGKQRKKDPSDFEERYEVRKAETKTEDWYWKINNSRHIAALLHACGVPLIATEDGKISTKKDILESLVDQPIVRDILTYREYDKANDFVWPIFDREHNGEMLCYGFADPFDRIHPIWSIHKISGRWAGSEPFGVSNPPREKTKEVAFGTTLPADTIILGVLCKQCKEPKSKHKDHEFVPGWIQYASRPTTKRQVVARKGRKLVGFDFKQIEARVLALLSGDEFMCDVFAREGDLHTECAKVVWKTFDQKSAKEQKQVRTVCKTLEYATWYGAADELVWKGLLKEGHQFKLADVVGSLNILRKKMSGIIQWQRETIHRASQPPYELRDLVLRRRRVWPMGQVEASEALNIVPQTTSASIMDQGMDNMDKRIYDRGYKEAYPIVQVHDAAVYECDENDAEKIAKDIEECFSYEHTNPVNGKTVKFPVDIGIGDSWDQV